MNSLGRKVLLASLAALAVLGGVYLLVTLELATWNRASAYVMRDYRRAIYEGAVQGGLARSAGELASFALTGDLTYLEEAREAMKRARDALDMSRKLVDLEPLATDRAVDLRLLQRQEDLLDAANDTLEYVAAAADVSAGGRAGAEWLSRVYSREADADQLWAELGTHHLNEQQANKQTLLQHSRRANLLLAGGLAVCVLGVGVIIVYVRRHVVAPLTALATLTRFVAAGDLRPRVAKTQSDEIGQLQRAFNQMMADLEQQRAQLNSLIESLAASRDAANEASRAKSDFLANVSHEIRTPMNGVLVSLDLLHETAANTQQRDLTDMARNSARRLLGMLNDLLSFSRSEAGSLKLQSIDFDPRVMIGQIIDLHGQRARAKGVAMSCRIDDAVPRALRGDPTRLGQVLLNLLDNAIKHTARGAIDVVVSADPAPADADPAAAETLLRVSVTDTGAGIPADAAPKIFQPFFQVGGADGHPQDGIGLGLGIARQLTHAMGGEIGFESQPGKGSTFWFTARLAAGSAVSAPALPAAPARPPVEGMRVLLAEDHRVTREVMLRTLQRRGLDVSAAENGRQALALAGSERFDLILMDCRMEGMDGFEAARAIRALGGARSRVPIIALTAFGYSRPRQDFIDSGFDDLVVKPYTLEDIEAVLQRWLAPEGARPAPTLAPVDQGSDDSGRPEP
jgi:signal transduction histidine kinase/ActR/RegA family two-component response regulator